MRRRSTVPCLLVALVALALAPQGAHAQAVLDHGTFRLTLAGQDVGSETFTIRQDGAGPAAITIAQGSVSIDTGTVAQELTSWLRLSPMGGRPLEYRLNIQGADREQISGAIVGGRFSARIVSPSGEMMREYLAGEGAVVIDEGITHQYYFLAGRAGSSAARVPVVVPRESRQIMATVSPAGTEAIEIGGRSVQARHLVVTMTGRPNRDLWVDQAGRILKLTVPATGFTATRSAVPS